MFTVMKCYKRSCCVQLNQSTVHGMQQLAALKVCTTDNEVCTCNVARRAQVVISCQSKCVHEMLQALMLCTAVNKIVFMECYKRL